MQPFFSIGNFQLTLSLLKSSYLAPLYKSSIPILPDHHMYLSFYHMHKNRLYERNHSYSPQCNHP